MQLKAQSSFINLNKKQENRRIFKNEFFYLRLNATISE
jgi:hypothetical protein